MSTTIRLQQIREGLYVPTDAVSRETLYRLTGFDWLEAKYEYTCFPRIVGSGYRVVITGYSPKKPT